MLVVVIPDMTGGVMSGVGVGVTEPEEALKIAKRAVQLPLTLAVNVVA